jgi:hypothetical protein
MTDATNTPNTSDKPAKAPAKVPARIEHSVAIAQYAKAKKIDTTKAGKLFRARLRANFDVIAKRDPKHYGPKGTFKNVANDKRPWGTHSRAVLKELGLLK